MRVVRLKLKPDVQKVLKSISQEFGVSDHGFAEDIFSMMRFKGNGLPSSGRLQKMSNAVAKKSKMPPIGVNLLMSKRKMLLESFAKLPYFKALCMEKDLILSVRRLLITFRTMYNKVRQAQCSGCQLKPSCQFGKQYGAVMSDITKVIDPNFALKVHVDCPHKPEISLINQVAHSVQALNVLLSQSMQPFAQAASAAGAAKIEELMKLAEEAADDPSLAEDDSDVNPDPEDVADNYNPIRGYGFGRTSRYTNAHTGAHICRVTEAFVQRVTNAQLAIFDLGHKFSIALSKDKTRNFKPVPHIDKDQKQDTIKSEADISKLVSSQHGLPEAVFENRLKKKQLIKQQFVKADERKQLLYLLVDSSNSMCAQLGSNSRHSLFTRGSLATVFSLSLVRKVRDDGGICYLRFFEGAPGPLHKAEVKQEFDNMYHVVNLNSYSGGGTSIMSALQAATNDIQAADNKSELAKAEIMLITDCGDSLDNQKIKKLLGKIKLSVLDVAGASETANPELKASADKYFKASEDAVDVNSLVSLL